MAQSTLPPLLTPAQVAELLGIPVRTLYTQRSSGRPTPRAVKVGRYLRFRPEDVAAFIESRLDPAP